MDRILRKHFTLKRIFGNLKNYWNSKTNFNRNIKIKILQQEFYKRIELVIVFIPLMLIFVLKYSWLDNE